MHALLDHFEETHVLVIGADGVPVYPVPAAATRGIRVARQGFRQDASFSADPHISPSGRKFLWIKGSPQHLPSEPGSDNAVNLEGYISVTPLRADLTAHDVLDDLAARLA